jgi:signal transduction histidine kinase/CheY-like chemotaxis protein
MATMALYKRSEKEFQEWSDRQLLALRSCFDLCLNQMNSPGAGSSIHHPAIQLFEIVEQQLAPDFPGTFHLRAQLETQWQIEYQTNNGEVLTPGFDEWLLTVSQCLSQQAGIMVQVQGLQQRCQSLEIEREELQQTSDLKSEFLANTSHEIRTPLSSILGFTHLLREQGFNPGSVRHQEYLRIILTSGQHLLALINDILDLSKIEANQLDLNWETIEVVPLCKLVLTLVQEKANDRGLKLISEVSPDIEPLLCDPLRLKQMLFNLLSNALKFTTQGGVGLRVTETPYTVNFTVWDTGVGIPREQLDRLFQPYQQLPQSPTRQAEGTGLGLALTRKFAELHQGRVDVVSTPEQGSQFTIVLPRQHINLNLDWVSLATQQLPEPVAQDGPPAVPAAPEINPLHRTIGHILLVEDNLNNAEMIMAYLQKKGYRVSWAKNHTELWEILPHSIPKIILMDIHLPDVNGFTLIQQLRENPRYKSIPIIAQTALAMSGDRQACLNAGATDYITKPLDLQQLTRMLKRYSEAKE